MLTVESRRDAHSCVTLGREHVALGGGNQNTVGKISPNVEESKSGEDVDGIFFAAEHGQAEIAHQRVSELVRQCERRRGSNHKLDYTFALRG